MRGEEITIYPRRNSDSMLRESECNIKLAISDSYGKHWEFKTRCSRLDIDKNYGRVLAELRRAFNNIEIEILKYWGQHEKAATAPTSSAKSEAKTELS